MTYSYNPHQHTKIWLSKDRDVFMNFENQMRLIDMRIKNPSDDISLVYDASLLNASAVAELTLFCSENWIIPVNVADFNLEEFSEKEKELFKYYKDEIRHLKEGGNLAVASDILRWIHLVYQRGTYTDFDVPVDTSNLPITIVVESPLLLNIGSLKLGDNELIISNNDYIAVVDGTQGKTLIEQVQDGILGVLAKYDSDFIEIATARLAGNSFLYSRISGYMKNRAESEYIEKSKIANQDRFLSSRVLRALINKVTTDTREFIDFNRMKHDKTNDQVIKRLRENLYDQLGIIKWFFFNKEYHAIKAALASDDDGFLQYLMKKERSLYIKSIVVCTTGPIEVGKCLFGEYVLSSKEFNLRAAPMSFNHYGLESAFQSQNSISMHESVFGMLAFLGTADGELSDSSWLEEGIVLQGTRQDILIQKKIQLQQQLPGELKNTQTSIKENIARIERESNSCFSFFGIGRQARQEKLAALRATQACFHDDTHEFSIDEFRIMLLSIKLKKKDVFAGLFIGNTQTIIEKLEKMSNQAQMFRVAKEGKSISYEGLSVW